MLAIDRTAELAECEAVLSSSLFAGHTNSSRFLKYSCDKFFAGVTHVTEVEVAVEALGRRRGLRSSAGLHRSSGSASGKKAAPRLLRERGCEPSDSPGPAPGQLPASVCLGKRGKSRWLKMEQESNPRSSRQLQPLLQPGPLGKYAIALFALVLVGLIAAGYLFYLHSRAKTQAPPAAARRPHPLPSAGLTAPDVLIMAGSTAKSYTDQLGHIWTADRYFDGGEGMVCSVIGEFCAPAIRNCFYPHVKVRTLVTTFPSSRRIMN